MYDPQVEDALAREQGAGRCRDPRCVGCRGVTPGKAALDQRAFEMEKDPAIERVTAMYITLCTVAVLVFATERLRDTDPDLAAHFAAALRLCLAIAAQRPIQSYGLVDFMPVAREFMKWACPPGRNFEEDMRSALPLVR